ncbi:helix-turn-helix transcriptional regulator [Litoreibacter roseus]|nr:LuxR family transcriptional regulator [Litoreibacter roseus]
MGLVDFLFCRGMKMVSYHHYDPQLAGDATMIYAEGFPKDWVNTYIAQKLYRIDPIPGLAATRSSPFRWSEIRKLTKLLEDEDKYMKDLEAAELGDGLAMRVFGPSQRTGYVGIGFGSDVRSTPSALDILEFQCAAQIAHLRYCEITTEEREERPTLSAREREILQWIARGKSNSVIAEILDLSPHTVDTMLRRIFEKLEVSDRTTAAIRGLGAGLLNYERLGRD